VTGAPTASRWPVANEDKYNITAKRNQRIRRVLFVLDNDEPQGSIKINKIETSSNYGRLTMRDASLLYEVDKYDAMPHTDKLW
jgi:hypothetical protein